MSDQRVPLPGSAPITSGEAAIEPRWSSPVDPYQKTAITITVRRRQDSSSADIEKQLLAGQASSMSREQALQAVSADPQDMSAVRSFIEQQGLTITAENPAARTFKVEGTLQQMDEAFGTTIGSVQDASGNQHLTYQGPLSLPQSLDGIITSVLGLDQRPAARSREARTE